MWRSGCRRVEERRGVRSGNLQFEKVSNAQVDVEVPADLELRTVTTDGVGVRGEPDVAVIAFDPDVHIFGASVGAGELSRELEVVDAAHVHVNLGVVEQAHTVRKICLVVLDRLRCVRRSQNLVCGVEKQAIRAVNELPPERTEHRAVDPIQASEIQAQNIVELVLVGATEFRPAVR